MKRLYGTAALLLLTMSAADAGQISFSVGGHRVRIEAPRNCRATSCASVSVSGLYNSRRRDRDEDDRDVTPPAAPAPAAAAPASAPVQVSPPPALPVQPKQIVAAAPPSLPPVPPPTSPPAVGFGTDQPTTQTVSRPALPPVPPPTLQSAATQPCVTPPPLPQPVESTPARPTVIKTLHEQEGDTPLGDWQTENKGVVRISQCGAGLCGHTLQPASDEKGEAVLINMKAKDDSHWTGNVYSVASGDTYYGTLNLKGPNTLRVEACALGRFYCSGNNWIRISTQPLITERQIEARPRS